MQNKPKPVQEVTETVPETLIEPSLTEKIPIAENCPLPTETSSVQTATSLLSEKEIQTSLTDGSVSVENAEAQTSLNQDLSQTNDTECSEDLSAKTNEDSLDNVQEPDTDEKCVIEVSEKDIFLDEPEPKVPDTRSTSSVSSPVSVLSSLKSDEPETKNETKSSKKSRKAKTKEQTADISHCVVPEQQPAVEETIPHLSETGRSKQVEVTTDSVVEKTEPAVTIPEEQSEIVSEKVESISLEISSPKVENILVKETEKISKFTRLEDFEFETPSEYQDVTSSSSFSPVEIFTQDITQMSEMRRENLYDPLDSDIEPRRRAKSVVLGSISETPFFSSGSKPFKTGEKLVRSFDSKDRSKISMSPHTLEKEAVDEVILKKVYSPTNAETVSTSTQCSQETMSQGVQSSLESAPKTDKATLTQTKTPKKKAKRSETALLAQDLVKIPTPESPIPLVTGETLPEKDEAITESVKSSPSDDWKNISEKILLRIRNTNSVPYSSLYLKDSVPPLNTTEFVHNFHTIILRIRSYLKCKDENNLRKSIADGAEDVSNVLDDLNCQIFAIKVC